MFSFSLLGMVVFSAPQAKADIWGAAYAAAALDNVLAMLRDQIMGMILGALKSAAIQVLNNQVNRLVGGSSAGKALFITNYESFLYQDPLQKTNLYMNDFFTLTTRGKSSSSNYVGVGDVGNQISGSYSSYLVNQAKQATIGSGGQQAQMTLDQYTPNPQQMFAEGDWRAFNAFFSNPANNSFGYTIMAQQAYQSKSQSEKELAQVKAQSSGFLPSEKNGQVIAPSGTIEAMAGKVQNIGSDLIAAASKPGEMMTAAVSAVATQMINKLVQQGVGEVQANMQKEVNSVTNEINAASNDALKQGGPGSVFSASVSQRTNVAVNPNTPAPPTASDTVAPCTAYDGQAGSCQQATSPLCQWGSTKSSCTGDLVCCYSRPTGTTILGGSSCIAYGKPSTCQSTASCKNGSTTSNCTGGLVCCYEP